MAVGSMLAGGLAIDAAEAASTSSRGANASGSAARAASTVPNGFSDTVAISGLTMPTDVAFAADGRVFVGEKSGMIKVFDSLSDTTPTVFADLRTQVHNFLDRGVLGLTLDPEFPTRPYVYVLYTHDAEPGGTAPRWGTAGGTSDGCPDPPGATTDGCVVQARLSRLTASGNQMSGAEQVLVGGWCQQFPSHSIGTVRFGPDGALYAGAGDGSSYNYVDYGQTKNPCGDPPAPAGTNLTPPTAEGGSLRSQSVRRPAGQPVSLDGTIIRVDPDTGVGLPGNPFASSADHNARRIIAYGLRNPFRFGLRPGTQQLWVGDVGWNTWEEINRVADVDDGVAENFGWPCYEGAGRQGGYDGANLNRCESLYAGAGQTGPFYTYNHGAQVVPGDACPTGSSSITGIAFEHGSNYPADYDSALFFADAARGCIWVMKRGGGADPAPGQISQFVGGGGSVVQVLAGPGGDIFYVDLWAGQIHRVVYNGANHPPTAVVSASPTSGIAPLTVRFDGSRSHDLDAAISSPTRGTSTGTASTTTPPPSRPRCTYTSNGTVTAQLRVRDPAGASDTESVTITVGPPNSPPVPVIDAPTSALRWKVGDADRVLRPCQRRAGRHAGAEQADVVCVAQPLPEQLPCPPAAGFRRRGERVVAGARPRVPLVADVGADRNRLGGHQREHQPPARPADGGPDLRDQPHRPRADRRGHGGHGTGHAHGHRRVVEQRERTPAGRRRHALCLRGLVGRGRGDPQRRRARHAHDLHGDVHARASGLPYDPESHLHHPGADGASRGDAAAWRRDRVQHPGVRQEDLRGLHRHHG